MRTSLKFFKDMGICDGAYTVLEQIFQNAGVTEFDYSAGYQMMLGMMGQIEQAATQSTDPSHATAEGWLAWCYNLRTRPEAIMYFGDHIEENLFRTSDGATHESLIAAKDHRKRIFNELRLDHAAVHVINGVIIGENGSETWQVIDYETGDLSQYSEFIWHDSSTGLNRRTKDLSEAIAYRNEKAAILDEIDKSESFSPILRKITDESGEYSVWITVDEVI